MVGAQSFFVNNDCGVIIRDFWTEPKAFAWIAPIDRFTARPDRLCPPSVVVLEVLPHPTSTAVR